MVALGPTPHTDAAHDVAVSPEQIEAVQALIAQRIATRKPAAYLTQEAWLQGVSFYIDERAIVPRSYIGEILDSDLLPTLMRQAPAPSDLNPGTASKAAT